MRWLRVLLVLAAIAWGGNAAAQLVPVTSLGLRVARGFRVSLYADADLANDIYAMTLDSRGDVVVTSQGYIRTLFDTDGDGRADDARDFASTGTGGMGMFFDGPNLYFVGDGALWRFSDDNADGAADAAPAKILDLHFGEHGGHAVRKGPDGWFYVIGGNETRFGNEHTSLPTSPIERIEAGALLRLPPTGQGCEAIAQGFRNPYSFDFNYLGDIFTYDSDGEREFLLPWYTPTRLYHVGYAGHHGWRLGAHIRSWARPNYYFDTVDILVPTSRGSPTGVAVYRHLQFPPAYRNGVFYCDWTFGRVYFSAVQPNGGTYEARSEVFLEPMGTHGFAPTDVVVATDGSLLVSIGGRKTRGGIYRIEYVAEGNRALAASNWLGEVVSELHAVLTAPQPLDSWSRAYWEPLAQQLGPVPFAAQVTAPGELPSFRLRAIEILTEMHGGLPPDLAAAGARANLPAVRARVAWSLGRVPPQNFARLLVGLSRDADALVRRCALDALIERAADAGDTVIAEAAASNSQHPDKRIRQSAAKLATYLSETAWKQFWNQQQAAPQSRLTATLALLGRSAPDTINMPAIDSALAVVSHPSPDLRVQALRLVIMGLGDLAFRKPSVEVYTLYEPALDLKGHESVLERIRRAVRVTFPSGDPTADMEASRILAMLQDTDPALPSKVLALIGGSSTGGSDFHYLTVLSRLQAAAPTNLVPKIAESVLSLERKLGGQEQRHKQNWTVRLVEVTQNLLVRYPGLSRALLANPNFVKPAHVALAPLLDAQQYLAAARLFFQAASKDPRFTWSAPLIDLLAILPPEEVFPLFRKQWSNIGLRDELLLKLAQRPAPVDREKFVAGLASPSATVNRASITALLKLPRDESGGSLVQTLRLLRRLFADPNARNLREEVVRLLNHQTEQSFRIEERGADPANLARAYQPMFAWFAQRNPAVLRQVDAGSQIDAAKWASILSTVGWERGSSASGERTFIERGCQTCHSTSSQLGPALSGVAARFAPIDLFNAIIFPNRDVAPPYQTTVFQMRDGSTYTGMIVFESADGYIVQTAPATTVRLATEDIVSQRKSDASLMPSGLLDGLAPQQLADLYAYLRTL